jgi:hypothetical protein
VVVQFVDLREKEGGEGGREGGVRHYRRIVDRTPGWH